MIFEYQCPVCSRIIEKDRLSKDHDLPVICPEHDIRMPQLIRGMQFHVKQCDGYNAGLGVPQRKVKDELKKINDTTGRKLEEVGNESAKVEKKPNDYKFTASQKREIGALLNG